MGNMKTYFSKPLPLRLHLIAGEDRWGFPYIELVRRDKISTKEYPAVSATGQLLTVTWGDTRYWGFDVENLGDGLSFGRVWVNSAAVRSYLTIRKRKKRWGA